MNEQCILRDAATGKPIELELGTDPANPDPIIREPILGRQMHLSEWKRAARESAERVLKALSGETDYI